VNESSVPAHQVHRAVSGDALEPEGELATRRELLARGAGGQVETNVRRAVARGATATTKPVTGERIDGDHLIEDGARRGGAVNSTSSRLLR